MANICIGAETEAGRNADYDNRKQVRPVASICRDHLCRGPREVI
ncbi:MAG: hypothetical protein ACLFVT_05475 [Syntrophobacteria bacterium]